MFEVGNLKENNMGGELGSEKERVRLNTKEKMTDINMRL